MSLCEHDEMKGPDSKSSKDALVPIYCLQKTSFYGKGGKEGEKVLMFTVPGNLPELTAGHIHFTMRKRFPFHESCTLGGG